MKHRIDKDKEGVIIRLDTKLKMFRQLKMKQLYFLVFQGPVVGDILDDVMPIFVTNLDTDKDPELRLKFFSLLSRLVISAGSTLDSCHKFGEFAVIVVKDIIIPNCVWKAGRVAGAIRTTATSCVWALLQSGVLSKDKVFIYPHRSFLK